MRRLELKIDRIARNRILRAWLSMIIWGGTIVFEASAELRAAEILTSDQEQQIFSTAEPAVVQLTVGGRLDGQNKDTIYGTGFAIQTVGGARIITAGHVIGKDTDWDEVGGRPDRDIWIHTLVNFGVLTLDPVNDAAANPVCDVAQVIVRPGATYLTLSDNAPQPGDQVMVVSWPFDKNARHQGSAKWQPATVLNPENGLLRLSGDFQVSESGSPVLDDKGEVAGVLVERRSDESGSAVQNDLYSGWLKGYIKPKDVFFRERGTAAVIFRSQATAIDGTKVSPSVPASQTDKISELAGRCIFLGKRSALSSSKPAETPFGAELLRKVVSKAGREAMPNTKLSPSSDVSLRSACPLVQPDKTALYGSVVGTLRPGEHVNVKSVSALRYANDTFYWAVVDKLTE
jgi:hypothetical protein